MMSLKVDGMTCQHCVLAVERALSGVPGVERVREVSLTRGEVFLEGSPDLDLVVAAVKAAGYTAGRTA